MLTLHHLNDSRSQRILWLLEELGTPYEIVRHQRNSETRLAPPELAAIHPPSLLTAISRSRSPVRSSTTSSAVMARAR